MVTTFVSQVKARVYQKHFLCMFHINGRAGWLKPMRWVPEWRRWGILRFVWLASFSLNWLSSMRVYVNCSCLCKVWPSVGRSEERCLSKICATLGDAIEQFSIAVCNQLFASSRSGDEKKLSFAKSFLQIIFSLRHFVVEWNTTKSSRPFILDGRRRLSCHRKRCLCASATSLESSLEDRSASSRKKEKSHRQ